MEEVTRVVREKGHGKEARKIHLAVDPEHLLVSDMNSLIITQAVSHGCLWELRWINHSSSADGKVLWINSHL